MRFYRSVAPAAMSRWAEGNGYRIEQQRTPLFFAGPYAWNARVFNLVYRVTVRDRDWHLKRGWVRLGRIWWPSPSVEECPIEVRWDRQPDTPSPSNALWDRDLDA